MCFVCFTEFVKSDVLILVGEILRYRNYRYYYYHYDNDDDDDQIIAGQNIK